MRNHRVLRVAGNCSSTAAAVASPLAQSRLFAMVVVLVAWFVLLLGVAVNGVGGQSTSAQVIQFLQDGYGSSAINSNHAVLWRSVVLSSYNTFPSGYSLPSAAFLGAVTDGQYLWLVPAASTSVLRVRKSTGAMTSFSGWPSGFSLPSGFSGGAFDGSRVWLAPSTQRIVVSFDVATATMRDHSNFPATLTFPTSSPTTAFGGASFDGGQYVWMPPMNANELLRIDVVNYVMYSYSNWPVTFALPSDAFTGAVAVGTSSVYLVPYSAASVLLVTPSSSDVNVVSMVELAWPLGFTMTTAGFWGAVYDNLGGLWLVPHSASAVIRVDTTSGTMVSYSSWPTGFTKGNKAFAGAAFDGRIVWMAPYDASGIVGISVYTGVMQYVASWPTGFVKGNAAFVGAVFDGSSVFLIPYDSSSIVVIRGDSASYSDTHSATRAASVTPSASQSLSVLLSRSGPSDSASRSLTWSSTRDVTQSSTRESVTAAASNTTTASRSLESTVTRSIGTLTVSTHFTKSSPTPSSSVSQEVASRSESATNSATPDASASLTHSLSILLSATRTRETISAEATQSSTVRFLSFSLTNNRTISSAPPTPTASASASLTAAKPTGTVSSSWSWTELQSESESSSTSASRLSPSQARSTTITLTASLQRSKTKSVTDSFSPSAAHSRSTSLTRSASATNSSTRTPSQSASSSGSVTATPTLSIEASRSRSRSQTSSATDSEIKPSQSRTTSDSMTSAASLSSSDSATSTPSRTCDVSITVTVSSTKEVSESFSMSREKTPTCSWPSLSPTRSTTPSMTKGTPSHLSSPSAIAPTQSGSVTVSLSQAAWSKSSSISDTRTSSRGTASSSATRWLSASRSLTSSPSLDPPSVSHSTSLTPSASHRTLSAQDTLSVSDSLSRSANSPTLSPSPQRASASHSLTLSMSGSASEAKRSHSASASTSSSDTNSPTRDQSRSRSVSRGSASLPESRSQSASQSETLTVSATTTHSKTHSGSSASRGLGGQNDRVTLTLTSTVTMSSEVTRSLTPTVRRPSPTAVETLTEAATQTMSMSLTVSQSLSPSNARPSHTESESKSASDTISSAVSVTSTWMETPTVTNHTASALPTPTQTKVSSASATFALVSATGSMTTSNAPSATASLSAGQRSASASSSASVSVAPTLTLRRRNEGGVVGLQGTWTTTMTESTLQTLTAAVTMTSTVTKSRTVTKSHTIIRRESVPPPSNAALVAASRLEAASQFLSGETSCVGPVVVVLVGAVSWLLLLVIWRHGLLRIEWLNPVWRCCHRASANQEGEFVDDEDSDVSSSSSSAFAGGVSSEAESAATKRSSRNRHRSSADDDDDQSRHKPTAWQRLVHSIRLATPEHVYLSSLFPCEGYCAVLHGIELLQHVSILMLTVVLLRAAWRDPTGGRDLNAWRVTTLVFAVLVAQLLRMLADVSSTRAFALVHRSRVWLSRFSLAWAHWERRLRETSREEHQRDKVMMTIVEMIGDKDKMARHVDTLHPLSTFGAAKQKLDDTATGVRPGTTGTNASFAMPQEVDDLSINLSFLDSASLGALADDDRRSKGTQNNVSHGNGRGGLKDQNDWMDTDVVLSGSSSITPKAAGSVRKAPTAKSMTMRTSSAFGTWVDEEEAAAVFAVDLSDDDDLNRAHDRGGRPRAASSASSSASSAVSWIRAVQMQQLPHQRQNDAAIMFDFLEDDLGDGATSPAGAIPRGNSAPPPLPGGGGSPNGTANDGQNRRGSLHLLASQTATKPLPAPGKARQYEIVRRMSQASLTSRDSSTDSSIDDDDERQLQDPVAVYRRPMEQHQFICDSELARCNALRIDAPWWTDPDACYRYHCASRLVCSCLVVVGCVFSTLWYRTLRFESDGHGASVCGSSLGQDFAVSIFALDAGLVQWVFAFALSVLWRAAH